VKYVEDKYYIRVSRYTTSGFMRLKLGQELGKRQVTSEVYETHKQARNHLTAKN
jgi:propionate CoA-transferase